MTSGRQIPIHLALAAKARSDTSLAKILAHKDNLTAKFQSGRMSVKEVMALGLGEFCRQADVGENLLNGDKYRDDVKPGIKSFIKDLKKLAKERSTDPEQTGSTANPQPDLEVRLSRVCDLLHEARLTLHSKRHIIRTLTSRKGRVVVGISDDETS
jgi:hypothetical protein